MQPWLPNLPKNKKVEELFLNFIVLGIYDFGQTLALNYTIKFTFLVLHVQSTLKKEAAVVVVGAHLITALKVNNCLNDRTASAEQHAHELLINAIVGNDLIRIISVSH